MICPPIIKCVSSCFPPEAAFFMSFRDNLVGVTGIIPPFGRQDDKGDERSGGGMKLSG